MSTPLPEPRATLARLMSRHAGRPVDPDSLIAVSGGASGRCIMRGAGVLGIYWTDARADNASFVPAARGLARAGVPVPELLAVDRHPAPGCGACLVTDLGKRDLLSLKDAPWEERRAAYADALRALRDFHRVKPDWPLQPPFDAELYRWEQAYFAEHVIGRHLGGKPDAFLAMAPLGKLTDSRAARPRVPVLRDCQSQNIMLCDGRAHFIDFQGMRMGLAEYDLASLLLDPYMNLGEAECRELLALWEEITGEPVDVPRFCACAMQRLMQALGAFGNIGHNQRRDGYLDLIPTGLTLLQRVARVALHHQPTADVATCLLAAV